MLDELCEDLQRQHKVSLRIGEEAEAAIAHAGYSSAYGARELSRALERLVKSPLSKLMLGGELKQHTRWEVVPGDEELSIIPVSGETL